MLLIYVDYGYSNKNETNNFWWGSLVTPVHACSHVENAGHHWEQFQKSESLIILLALFELPQNLSPQIVYGNGG